MSAVAFLSTLVAIVILAVAVAVIAVVVVIALLILVVAVVIGVLAIISCILSFVSLPVLLRLRAPFPVALDDHCETSARLSTGHPGIQMSSLSLQIEVRLVDFRAVNVVEGG